MKSSGRGMTSLVAVGIVAIAVVLLGPGAKDRFVDLAGRLSPADPSSSESMRGDPSAILDSGDSDREKSISEWIAEAKAEEGLSVADVWFGEIDPVQEVPVPSNVSEQDLTAYGNTVVLGIGVNYEGVAPELEVFAVWDWRPDVGEAVAGLPPRLFAEDVQGVLVSRLLAENPAELPAHLKLAWSRREEFIQQEIPSVQASEVLAFFELAGDEVYDRLHGTQTAGNGPWLPRVIDRPAFESELNNASGALEDYYHPILSADEAIERSLVELRLGAVITPTRTVAKLVTERDYEEWMYDGSAITESDQPFWVVAFEIPEQSASSVMMFADSEDRVTGVFYGWSALQGGGRSHRTGEIGLQWNTSLDSLEALPDYPLPIETPSAIPTRRVFDR